MKITNKYRLILIFFTAIFAFTSCLNDSAVEDQEYGLIDLDKDKIIEIPAGGTHMLEITSLDEGIKEFVREIRLAADQPASEDIVVNLEIISERSAVIKSVRELLSDRYPTEGENEVPDEDINIYPVSGVTIPASVTIKKGERSAPLSIKIDTHILASEAQFIVVKVKSVDKPGYIISGNFGQLLLNMKVKHKYAGRYKMTGVMEYLIPGSFFHVTYQYGLQFPGEDFTVQLQTYDGQSLVMYDEIVFGDYIYPMSTATGFSGWGSFAPIFKFDDAGNVIAVTNYYGQPASNTRSAVIDPAGVNKYDEATKSFQVSYWMAQPNAVAAPPHYRTHMVETYTFIEDI